MPDTKQTVLEQAVADQWKVPRGGPPFCLSLERS